jgi:hypothetical protein
MEDFKKGDILVGQKRAFDEAYHPVVYIAGPKEAPIAVILTHSKKFPCNKELLNIYDGKENKAQYFVAHLIEKVAEWGHYEKIGRLQEEDLNLIESQISNSSPMTWSMYMEYVGGKQCFDHNSINAREGSL